MYTRSKAACFKMDEIVLSIVVCTCHNLYLTCKYARINDIFVHFVDELCSL